MRQVRTGFNTRIGMCRNRDGQLIINLEGERTQRTAEYFKVLLDPRVKSGVDFGEEKLAQIEKCTKESPNAPDLDEIRDAIKKMKSGKATREYIITKESKGWEVGVIYPIYKKGEKTELYGCSFTKYSYKILAVVLCNRLEKRTLEKLHSEPC